MNIIQLKIFHASLVVLSMNYDKALEIANGDIFAPKVIEAKSNISDYAYKLPEEVKMRFRKLLFTEGSVMSIQYAASDIRRCINALNAWIQELEAESE